MVNLYLFSKGGNEYIITGHEDKEVKKCEGHGLDLDHVDLAC